MLKTPLYITRFFLKNIFNLLVLLFVLIACQENAKKVIDKKGLEIQPKITNEIGVTLVVLGTVQDAGSPHIACKKECCVDLFENPIPTRKVVSLGIIDHADQQTFLIDATPDISEQVKLLKRSASWEANELPNGIFLTHAHIGHYTGLMYLGKEATNAKSIPTYVMPKMKDFIEQNGPWSQLVSANNVLLFPIENKKETSLTSTLKMIPLKVPHRDEFSETVGYKITGPSKSALFIPDIDKWEKWETNIAEVIKTVDYAFLDASFYDGDELNTRDISQIPHPFVIESMNLFEKLSSAERQKIYFIHFNHTNGLLNTESEQTKIVLEKGFNIARYNQKFEL